MIEAGNRLTEKAQEWYREHALNKGFTGKDNPVVTGDDGNPCIKFNEIRMSNYSKVDGVGINVNYYWQNWKVCVFPVNNISLDMAPALNSLNLNGIIGYMRIQVKPLEEKEN